jgi:Zn-dependent protease with chaperone function
MARFNILFCTLLLVGCAGLETRPPSIGADATRDTRVKMQQQAIAVHIERTKQLQDLAWPILQKNADLCGRKVNRTFGWRMLDRTMVARFTQGLRDQDITDWSNEARVVLLVAGGPAEKAGIRINDRVLKVNERDVPADLSVAIVSKMITDAVKKTKTGDGISLSVAQPGENLRTVRVTPEKTCAFPVALNRAGAVNASTNGARISIFMGLMRAEPDPRRIQFVIAHELAHAVLKHPQKSVRNSLVSGGAVLGTLAGAAGWIADTTATLAGKKPTASYQRRGAALATYPYGRDFEREADYVGLYMLARAGIDTSGVEELFSTFAQESPAGTWLNLSHPSSPERYLAARATQAEIKSKLARGDTLLPEGFTLKETGHGRANP